MADAGKQKNRAALLAPSFAKTCLEANATGGTLGDHIPSAACAALMWNEAKDPSCQTAQTAVIPHEQV